MNKLKNFIRGCCWYLRTYLDNSIAIVAIGGLQFLLLITVKWKNKDIFRWENVVYYLIRALDSFSAMEK